MPNSIDFYKGIFVYVIPVRIVASCCDHTAIKRNQALNCYSFLELKQQNLKDAIYFLSLMSYSINKLKVYMLFISKNLLVSVFRFYVEKKILLQKMVVVVVVKGVELPPSTALHSPPPIPSVQALPKKTFLRGLLLSVNALKSIQKFCNKRSFTLKFQPNEVFYLE